MKTAKTLFEKIWECHVVESKENHPDILFIDAHFIHEVTSPQAFDGLRKRGLPVFCKERTWATVDHNIPTQNQHLPIRDELSRKQVSMLAQNCKEFGVELFGLGHPNQGIVHVIGPEMGVSQPGMTIVCGDSHTSTHGAMGAIAFGIGTSEVEEVLASGCILQVKPKTMKININGKLGKGVYAKDLILYLITKLSTCGGNGYFIEYSGDTIRELSMEARMTICNMSIEMGARGGLIAPDQTTFDYLKGKAHAPKNEDWEEALEDWKALYSDVDAKFDLEYDFDASVVSPMLTYGTNPGMGISIRDTIPLAKNLSISESNSLQKALLYMNLNEGEGLIGKKIDYVFIGSCTNSRIEDLRLVAAFLKGKQKSPQVEAWIVPGSKAVEKQAIQEGLDKIFLQAGFELREPGCSACLGMNEDKIPAGKYAVSTSNRNFEGRQGPGARTILASPLTAALAAVKGTLQDIREFID